MKSVIAVLIGFQYNTLSLAESCLNHNKKKKGLPGIQPDLYHAFLHAKNIGADRISIITDINKDNHSSILAKSAVCKTSNADVFNFIENSKAQGYHHLYRDVETFSNLLETLIKDGERVFIYYTGHCKDRHLLLPGKISDTQSCKSYDTPSLLLQLRDEMLSYVRYSLDDFRRIIVNNVAANAEVLVIMDCCYSTGLNLPFLLTPHLNRYRLTGDVRHFTVPKIICISSTNSRQKSMAKIDGSVFSNILFESFQQGVKSLTKLVETVSSACQKAGYRQEITIHSSYPEPLMLWAWFFKASINIKLIHTDAYFQLINRC